MRRSSPSLRDKAASTSSVELAVNNFLADREERIEPLPLVADQAGAAAGRFEQAPGRRPARLRHVAARHVQGQAGRRIKRRMFRGRQMPDEIDVVAPGEIGGILRAGQNKAPLGQTTRGREKQSVELCLTVGRIGADIGEVAAVLRLRLGRGVDGGIYMTIERRRTTGARYVPSIPEALSHRRSSARGRSRDIPRAPQ